MTTHNHVTERRAALSLTVAELDEVIGWAKAQSSVDPDLYFYLVSKRRKLDKPPPKRRPRANTE